MPASALEMKEVKEQILRIAPERHARRSSSTTNYCCHTPAKCVDYYGSIEILEAINSYFGAQIKSRLNVKPGL